MSTHPLVLRIAGAACVGAATGFVATGWRSFAACALLILAFNLYAWSSEDRNEGLR